MEEGEVYCRHCGTQLLYPEDELIEEDIPGEKIVLEDQTGEEKMEEAAPEEKTIEETGFEEGTAALTEEGKTAAEESPAGETRETIEEEAKEAEEREMREEEMKPKWPERGEPRGETEEPAINEEEAEYPGGILDELTAEETKEEARRERETSAELKPELKRGMEELRKSLRFPTGELDRITRSVDEAKKEVEAFLFSLKEKTERRKLERTDEEKANLPPTDEEMAEEKETIRSETKEETPMPPWAEAIRDRVEKEPGTLTDLSPVVPSGISFEEITAEEKEESKASGEASPSPYEELAPGEREPKPWQADSGVGLPEKPGQQPLPFEVARGEEGTMPWQDKEAEERELGRPKARRKSISWGEEEAAKKVKPTGEEVQEEEEEEVKERPTSRSFKTWLKARFFDLVFIGLVWMITFLLAARVAAASFFGLLAVSPLQAVALFLIFFVGYLFLFRFFIGETLGDRLFSSTDSG
ncbi:MAG: hypothetical protein ACUVR0_10455 [Candidatus Aminicenantales bacterium]